MEGPGTGVALAAVAASMLTANHRRSDWPKCQGAIGCALGSLIARYGERLLPAWSAQKASPGSLRHQCP